MRKYIVFLLYIAVIASVCNALRVNHKVTKLEAAKIRSDYVLSEMWYEQQIDHFNYESTADTYRERVLFSTKDWNKCKGPVFFYTGNEGDIYMFAKNTGFMYTLAQKFGGAVVFAEHRYYGASLPYGDRSLKHPYIQYLTTEQALADYVVLIDHLMTKSIFSNCSKPIPVIAVGGSYGGMLAAYARVNYPGTFAGALASSAPITMTWQIDDNGVYAKAITQDFRDATVSGAKTACDVAIFNSMMSIMTAPLDKLNAAYPMCTPLTANDRLPLQNLISNAIQYMAMTDYPTPANFLSPMPAWPVNVTCQLAANMDALSAGLSTLQVYYNTSGKLKCFDVNMSISPDLGDDAWNYQACTEMYLPYGFRGEPVDMFPPAPWNLVEFTKWCKATEQVTPRPRWAFQQWAGPTVVSQVSNIIYSSGYLDPWSAGGVAPDAKMAHNSISLWIKDGAHHVDLRTPDPADPQSVKAARETEIAYITRWLQEF